jgi:hypothetical protein
VSALTFATIAVDGTAPHVHHTRGTNRVFLNVDDDATGPVALSFDDAGHLAEWLAAACESLDTLRTPVAACAGSDMREPQEPIG